MHRQVKKISISFVTSCLLLTFGYGETPCQNGHNYNNKCDPYYNINLIEAKVPSSRRKDSRNTIATAIKVHSKKQATTTTKHYTTSKKDLTYLDSLRRKYSKQFNGRMGLQALIDRSDYSTLKKPDTKDADKKKKLKKEDTNKIAKNSKTVDNKKEIAQKDTKKVTKISKKKDTKKVTKISKKKDIKTAVKKSKVALKDKTVNYYIVKSGDSLIKISKKLGIQKELILKVNKLDKNATIKIGQKLKLPTDKSVTKVAKISKKIDKSKNKLKKKSIDKNIYVVQKGDSLSAIAKKLRISITKLREYNRLSRSSKIRVGQKLLLKHRRSDFNPTSYDIVKNTKIRKAPSLKYKRKIRVVATAYTSHRNQTDKTPFLAAWNNRIRPGMKIIAVSPDLIKKYGLTNGVKVKILGLPGYYVVRDKMNKRLRNHIDIYMGVNKRKALRWGRRRIVLYW